MLLDRGATAICKPELEIYADDVKCAHGASVGELDATQLFYAKSRGLDPANARALLLEGFVMGLWETRRTAMRLRSRAGRVAEGVVIRAVTITSDLSVRDDFRGSPAGIISTARQPRKSRRR